MDVTETAASDAYLILDRAARTAVGRGFDQDGAQWTWAGCSVEASGGGVVTLHKPLLSSAPLFYAANASVFLAASRWRSLVDLLKAHDIAPRVNEDFVVDYLQYPCPLTRETFCRQISVLRNGETVEITADDSARTRLDSIKPPGPDSEITAADVRARLRARLPDPGLPDAGDAVYHLSSGLDSSLLVLLAAESATERPLRVATCRTRGRGAADELAVVESVSARSGLDLRIFDFTGIDIWQAGRDVIEAMGYPIAHPSHLVRFLLDREIARLPAAVIVTGRGPDECLGGYLWHRPDFDDPARHLARLCCTPDPVLHELLRTTETGATARHHPVSLSSERLSLTDRLQFDLRTIFEAWNIIEGALADHLRVAYARPFLDPELMRFFLNLPDDRKVSEGVAKRYLRETFADVYPEEVLAAPKLGLTIDLADYFRDFSVDEILRRIVDDSAFGTAFYDRAGCERAIAGTLDGTRNLGWQLWSLYLCALAHDRLMS